MAQTPPPSTATTYQPPPRAFWLTVVAAAVSWVLTVAGAIAEITDGFPRGLVGLAAVLAGSITVGAMYQCAEHASLRRHAEVVEAAGALREQVTGLGEALAAERVRYASAASHAIAKQSVALGQLAAEVEQMSAKVAALPSGEDLAEAVAATYRRGLVNGAQQLAAGGEGRPLRVAGTDN